MHSRFLLVQLIIAYLSQAGQGKEFIPILDSFYFRLLLLVFLRMGMEKVYLHFVFVFNTSENWYNCPFTFPSLD